MTLSHRHFQLTPERHMFKDLITPYSNLAQYWDWEARCLDEARLDQAMGVFSHSEQIMATFFRNVWTGNVNPPQGLIDAVGTLPSEYLAVIIGESGSNGGVLSNQLILFDKKQEAGRRTRALQVMMAMKKLDLDAMRQTAGQD